MWPINHIGRGFKWPKCLVIFTPHIGEVFHDKIVGDLGPVD